MNIPDIHKKAQSELTSHQYNIWVCWVLGFLEGFATQEHKPDIYKALEDCIEGVKEAHPEGGK